MWTPFDLFFIIWHCNFSPCQEARLNVKDIIREKENKTITESVTH